MVAYNFQARFVDAVESGAKRTTIRAFGGKPHPRVGDSLQLYTGMRTKACRKLVDPDPICTVSALVKIGDDRVQIGHNRALLTQHPGSLQTFAHGEGFDDFGALVAWFRETHGLPFVGVLIRWAPFIEVHHGIQDVRRAVSSGVFLRELVADRA